MSMSVSCHGQAGRDACVLFISSQCGEIGGMRPSMDPTTTAITIIDVAERIIACQSPATNHVPTILNTANATSVRESRHGPVRRGMCVFSISSSPVHSRLSLPYQSADDEEKHGAAD